MKCDEFETRLNELLDARASMERDEQLVVHAGLCDSCRQQLAALGMIFNEIASRPRPLPDAGVTARVIAEFAAPQVDRSMARRSMPYAFAVAVALLVAAFPVWRMWNDHTLTGDTTVATVAVSPDALVAATDAQNVEELAAEPPIGDLVREVGDRYTNLARETQANYAELALLLPGVRVSQRASRPDADEADLPETKASQGWVNDMADGLKPVTDSTRGAFAFLIEALPTEVSAEKL